MNIERLKKDKVQLEQQREQAIAQINQIVGAIATLDTYIKELEKELEPTKPDTKEIKTPLKNAA